MSGGNGSRKYVGIQVKLEGKETIKKDLQDIFKYVENNKNIKINFDDVSLNSFNNLKQALNEIQKDILKISNSSLIPQNINTSNADKQLNNLYFKYEKIGKKIDELKNKGTLYNSVFAGNSKTKSLDSLYKNVDFSNLEKAKQQIQQITNEIDRLSRNVSKIDTLKIAIDSIKNSYNNLKSGSNKKVFETLDKSSVNEYQKAYQELLNMRNKLKSENGKDISFKNINNSIDATREKLKVLQNQFNSNLGIDKLITKAETAFNKLQLNSSQLNSDVLQKLQTQFNSFNTKTASNEITNFIQRCNQLGKTDSLVLKVQKAISSLNNSMRNLTISNGGNLKSSNELTEYSNKLKELKSLMNQMKNGTFINSGTLNSSILSANNSFNRLKTTVKETSTAMKQTNSSAISLGSSISATLSKFGIYTSMALACRKLFEEFKQGVEYVKYLDESFTDMKMTMTDLTENEFNVMGEQLDEMAKKMGVTIEAVHDIGRIYSNEQTSTSEILEKTKPTAEFSNISGMDALTATKNMQDITNQFKLLENEGAKASEVFSHVGDVMTAVSKNMVYDFSSGLQQLSSAISTAGSVAQMSGVSMEKFTAEVGALIEQTGMSGSEVATG